MQLCPGPRLALYSVWDLATQNEGDLTVTLLSVQVKFSYKGLLAAGQHHRCLGKCLNDAFKVYQGTSQLDLFEHVNGERGEYSRGVALPVAPRGGELQGVRVAHGHGSVRWPG